MSGAQLNLLGPVAAHGPDGEISVGGRNPRLALALLASSAPAAVSSDLLIEEIWGDSPVADPASSLHVLISRLRTSIQAVGFDIERTTDAYRLAAINDQASIDVHRFADAVTTSQAALARQDYRAAQELSAAGLGLWRGAPFGDVGESLALAAAATRLSDHYARLVEVRVEALLALDRNADVITLLSEYVSQNPYREGPVGQLATAQYRNGDQREALRTIDQARARLLDDLGLDPGPELRSVEQAILAQSPVLDRLRLPAAPDAAEPIPEPKPDQLLVGRSQQLAQVRSAISEHRHLLVTGPAGTGKTTLVSRSAALVGRCVDLSGTPPLWPWPGIIDQVDQRYAGALAPPAVTRARDALSTDTTSSVFNLSLAVLEALKSAAAIAPVIVVEDLHWADEASMQLLRFLMSQLDDGPVIIATSRSLPESLLTLGRVDHVTVQDLDHGDVARLLHHRLGLPAPDRLTSRVMAESLGNPLLVRRALDVLDQPTLDIRSSRTELTRSWLSAVDPTHRETLEVAALLGEHFHLDELAIASGKTPTQVLQAVSAGTSGGLLTSLATDRASFVHALARMSLIDPLTPDRRATVHLAIATMLLAHNDLASRRAELVSHLGAAGPLADPGLVHEHARIAIDECSAHGAHRRAVELLDIALNAAATMSLSADDRLDLELYAARVLWNAGDVAASRERFAQAASMVETDDLRLPSIAADYAGFGMASVALDDVGFALLERVFSHSYPPSPTTTLDLLRCRTRHVIGTFDEATIGGSAQALEEEARDAGDATARTWALGALLVGSMTMRGTTTRRDRSLDMIALGEELGSDAAIGLGLVHRADGLAESGSIEACEAVVHRIGQLADATGRSAHVWYHRQYLGALRIAQGEFELGEALIAEALGAGQETRLEPALQAYAGALNASRLAQGRAGELLELIAPTVQDQVQYSGLGFNPWELGIGLCALDAGDLDQAGQRLEAVMDTTDRVRIDRVRSFELAQLIDLGIGVSNAAAVELGRSLLAEHSGRCCAAPSLILAGSADAWLGVADLFLGDRTGGDALVHQGQAQNQAWGLRAWVTKIQRLVDQLIPQA